MSPMKQTLEQVPLIDVEPDDKFYRLELNPDEPVFPIRGQDKFAVRAMTHYAAMCLEEGLADQAAKVFAFIRLVKKWQADNNELMKYPD